MALTLKNAPPPSSSSPFRLSPSSMRTYQSCPRKFKHTYLDGIEGKQLPDDKLQFGTAIHAAIEQNINRAPGAWSVRESARGLDVELGALVAGVAAAYASYWTSTLHYKGAEISLETELRNPRLTLLTIVDGLGTTAAGELVLVEHKTTESDIRPGSFYWERTLLDLQGSAYIWAARLNGHDVAHVEWDAIKKPRLTRRIEAVAPEYYVKSGKWGSAGDLKPGTGIPAETPLEFAKRVKETILADPTTYFQRNPVVRLEDELDAALADIEQTGEQILASWDSASWPRNTASCMAWGRRCSFWELCTGSAQPTDDTLYQLRKRRA